MQMEIEVKGQRIKRLNSPGSVEDTLNYLTCYFTFDGEEWDNTVKTAYFRNPASGKTYSQILAEDNTCTVPWEALTDKGFVRFSVAGEREDYRITTNVESFCNSGTIYGGNPSEPPTPDQYDQMIALAERTKEIAESVRKDANEGKFDGEPGKQGNPGRDGVSPTALVEQTDDGAVITITDATGTTTAELKNGKEGNPGQNATDEQVRGAVDAYMAEHPVQVDTDDLIKIAIKEEASGAVPIVTTDSAEMGVQDLTMQGWTKQDSTTGAQLFDKSEIVLSGTTITYMPVNVGDGEYTLSTNYIAPGQNDVFFLPGNVNTGASSSSNGVQHGTSRTVTSENGYVTVALRLSSDGTTSPLDYQIMLNEGPTALQYEPYTGGQPAPNPDYPQEIVSAGNMNEETQKYEYQVKLTGKNLWNAEEAAETSKWVASTSQKGYSDFAIEVKPGEKVTFSFPEKLPLGKGFYAGIVTSENGSIFRWLYHDLIEHLIVQQATVTAITDKIWIRCNTGTILKFASDNPYFQIEYGEERTDFQPYKNQTVTLTSDRPLTKWDRLEKRNGQWGWVYKSNMLSVPKAGYIALNSLAKDRKYFTAANLVPDSKISSNPREGSQYCNICNLGNPYEYEGNLFWIYRYSENKNGDLRIGLSDTSIDTKELFEQYISDKDIYIWYETEEETFVPLSESEQSALNALTTYYPTTVLDNDQGCDMALTYIADTKAYIDNKVSAIQAAIINTI